MRHFTSFYCERCGQLRRFTKRGLETYRHVLGTIVTCGLWAIPWWFLRRREDEGPWRCCMCNARQTPKEEPPHARVRREQHKSGSVPPIAPRREPRG